MTGDESKFTLPPKVDSYLATLNRLYESQNESLLRELIVNASVSIHEEWDYDNWDGGTYGHAVTLTVSENLYVRVMNQKDEIQTRVATDLNKLDTSRNEHISVVFVEMQPAGNENWREETGVYRPSTAVSPTAKFKN